MYDWKCSTFHHWEWLWAEISCLLWTIFWTKLISSVQDHWTHGHVQVGCMVNNVQFFTIGSDFGQEFHVYFGFSFRSDQDLTAELGLLVLFGLFWPPTDPYADIFNPKSLHKLPFCEPPNGTTHHLRIFNKKSHRSRSLNSWSYSSWRCGWKCSTFSPLKVTLGKTFMSTLDNIWGRIFGQLFF